MMFSPEAYVSMHNNDSLDQLISERERLHKELNSLEKLIINPDYSDEEWLYHPSPSVRYQMVLKYMAELCKLIAKKCREMDDDFEEEETGIVDVEIKNISITDVGTEAIVNAANSELWAGGGVCGAIFKAAGMTKLQAACNKIGHCDTGSAVITPGFNLCPYIIHAVGPVYRGELEEELLMGAYLKSLRLCKENSIKSVGFPLISSGIFGYPIEEAWRAALKACKKFEEENYEIKIVFAILDKKIIEIGNKLKEEIF